MPKIFIKANFSDGENQVTVSEHLYQWDTNQTISITLRGDQLPRNLDGEPDFSTVMVHFANKFSENALVTSPDGWMKISEKGETDPKKIEFIGDFFIPNSLLEQATPIFAYVTTLDYETFNTIKLAIIMVEPRTKPNDYVSKQDYVYTLEVLRAEMKAIINSYENDRNADYQEFKNQIKNDIQNWADKSKPELKSFEYLTDTSVKYNGVTYTITKDETTGLIKHITDSNKNYFTPTINSGITDVPLHNSVFMTIAMLSKLDEPTFDMSGIIGMFTPTSRNIANNLWRNEISGYNDIVLTGGSENGNAIHFEEGEYGSFTCSEPNTVYAIFKQNKYVTSASAIWYPIITKHITYKTYNRAFDLFSTYFPDTLNCNRIMFSGYDSDVGTLINTANYHVVCYTRSENTAKLYVDGVFIGEISGVYTGTYDGNMLINTSNRGGVVPENHALGKTDLIMCAFGTEYHNEASVQRSMAYLSKKYGITG